MAIGSGELGQAAEWVVLIAKVALRMGLLADQSDFVVGVGVGFAECL